MIFIKTTSDTETRSFTSICSTHPRFPHLTVRGLFNNRIFVYGVIHVVFRPSQVFVSLICEKETSLRYLLIYNQAESSLWALLGSKIDNSHYCDLWSVISYILKPSKVWKSKNDLQDKLWALTSLQCSNFEPKDFMCPNMKGLICNIIYLVGTPSYL